MHLGHFVEICINKWCTSEHFIWKMWNAQWGSSTVPKIRQSWYVVYVTVLGQCEAALQKTDLDLITAIYLLDHALYHCKTNLSILNELQRAFLVCASHIVMNYRAWGNTEKPGAISNGNSQCHHRQAKQLFSSQNGDVQEHHWWIWDSAELGTWWFAHCS